MLPGVFYRDKPCMWCIKKENILKDIGQLEDDTPKHQENSKVSVKNVQKKIKKHGT